MSMCLKTYTFGIVITLLWFTMPVRAECDCAQIPEKHLYQCSDAVFIGHTTEVVPFAAQITVSKVFKGRVEEHVVVAAVTGDCGYGVSFEPDREYLFHVQRGEAATDSQLEMWRISMCTPALRTDESPGASGVASLRRYAWWWKLPLSGWCHR